MCGIWALLSQISISTYGKYYDSFMKIKHRGPEYSSFDLINPYVLLGFHRLAIMDLSADGHQPFHHVREDGSCIYCICNGEIYDHMNLRKEYNIITKSHSDCEVIIPLYEKLGVDKMIRLLGSEFCFVIFDISKDGHVKMFAGRDPIGVRPGFYGINDNSLCFSSEMKGLSDIYDKVFVFPPGHYMIYENNQINLTQYYTYQYKEINPIPSMDQIYKEIRQRFINCVRKRLMADRPFGALLSGGLDSSLVCGVMIDIIETEDEFKNLRDKEIELFTIGFKSGSTDMPYAIEVVNFLRKKHPKIKHHIIEIDENEALNAIDETIHVTGSWDLTTIRASTMQYLVARYIKEKTSVRILNVGELSDELFSSYLYNHYAPSAQACREDSIRLVRDVHKFDGLRTDRTMASQGLEVRLPFADIELIDYIFSLPPEYTMPQNGLEKTLLRDSFKYMNIIPENIRLRVKNAFSDAVSKKERSWYQIIQDDLEIKISDIEFIQTPKDKFKHCSPFTKESYYYRKKFVEYYGESEEKANTIPYFWMPKWTNETTDPSARTLKVYKE